MILNPLWDEIVSVIERAAAGWVRVFSTVVLGQPFASVIFTVYVPAFRLS